MGDVVNCEEPVHVEDTIVQVPVCSCDRKNESMLFDLFVICEVVMAGMVCLRTAYAFLFWRIVLLHHPGGQLIQIQYGKWKNESINLSNVK